MNSITRNKIYVMSLDNRSRMHARIVDSMDGTLDLARQYSIKNRVYIAGQLMIELENDQD